jgi:signal transduction histidine kinase
MLFSRRDRRSAIAAGDHAIQRVRSLSVAGRLAPDAVSFQPAPLELAAVLKGAIGDLAPAALAKGMDIELTHEQHVLVSGDADLLAILFRNLIDNALRYSPPATRVAIQIERGDDEALVRITDAGPGISASERANIGRRFYRAPGTQAPGSGLGLSIVHRILVCTGAGCSSMRHRQEVDYRSPSRSRVCETRRV